MNKYLAHYLVAVEHPEVSAFEHLEMLLVRDKLAEQESSLTAEQRAQLLAADRRLLGKAAEFHAELARITNLENERQRRQPSPSRWWWYLDVLTLLPVSPHLRSGAQQPDSTVPRLHKTSRMVSTSPALSPAAPATVAASARP